jgi:hypothetical protein
MVDTLETSENIVTNKKKRFNLSFKRIFSRLIITFFVGIGFGIAMFPFMTVANNLLYEQRASIGDQNIIKMIVLWGLFTAIFSFLSFWKKRLRMVSVLLGICFVISIIFYVLVTIKSRSLLSCNRAAPYEAPAEINRALDLIVQRMNIENGDHTYMWAAFNYRNCLNVQYSDLSKQLGAEGLFFNEDESLQNLNILLSPDYINFDDLTIATLLTHELSHVGRYITDKETKKTNDCFDDEAEAFLTQLTFLLKLNPEEIRSINARMQTNINANPIFTMLPLLETRRVESMNACNILRKSNNLTDEQFNSCGWTGIKNKLLLDVKESKAYQEECK